VHARLLRLKDTRNFWLVGFVRKIQANQNQFDLLHNIQKANMTSQNLFDLILSDAPIDPQPTGKPEHIRFPFSKVN
jgi:hypothetical protein